jgi:stage V sporulation protein G
MKITDVKVFPVEEDKLKAYATITFDNSFIVRDLKVISGNKGFFIAMPSKKRKDGTFRDVAHPLNSETRKMIEDAVLDVYKKEIESGSVKTEYKDDDVEDAVHESGAVESEAVESEAVESDAVESEAVESDAVSGETEGTPAGSEDPKEPENPNESELEKRAEENPDVEPTDDPDKAFGYEE